MMCPHCGSSHLQSRRQLFYRLAREQLLPEEFYWYHLKLRGAEPPSSLSVIVLVLALALLPPLWLGLWWFDQRYFWVAIGMGLLVLLALVLDRVYQYQNYKIWAGTLVCGLCRGITNRIEAE